MSDYKKDNWFLSQIVAPVIVALFVGGTAPWWWNELFTDRNTSQEDLFPKPSPNPPPPKTRYQIPHNTDPQPHNKHLSITEPQIVY
ncbi:MAG: hypothetical protein WCI11_19950 [Candidatus Methylumidiphilus sp.]